MNLTKNAVSNDLIPSESYLSQNYPNPFSETTIIKFCVAYRTKVRLEVFNSEGKRVRTLLDEEKEAGTYAFEFSAKHGDSANLAGGPLSPSEGIYICRLQAGDFSATKQMTVLPK